MKNKIMVVTGEASGDLHGSKLVRALQALDESLVFYGMGGPELAKAGLHILFPAEKVSVVGIFEVFAHLKDIIKAQRILKRELRRNPPDILVLIDLPDFNLLLAKTAKKLGIPVFYYVAPQIWAWRTGRAKTIAKRVDKLGVILPFEEQFFKEKGIEAEYVGHPLLDSVNITSARSDFLKAQDIPDNNKIVGLLPGSRKREIESLLPDFLEAAKLLNERIDSPIVFLMPLAPTLSQEDLDRAGLNLYKEQIDVRVVTDNRYDMMNACDCVVAASGTVTLELAILEKLMVVTYRLAPLTYRIAKLLVKLPFFSLVNLIGGKRVVPELLQDEVTPERICQELMSILTNDQYRQTMKDGLSQVRSAIGEKGASERVARSVYCLMHPENN